MTDLFGCVTTYSLLPVSCCNLIQHIAHHLSPNDVLWQKYNSQATSLACFLSSNYVNSVNVIVCKCTLSVVISQVLGADSNYNQAIESCWSQLIWVEPQSTLCKIWRQATNTRSKYCVERSKEGWMKKWFHLCCLRSTSCMYRCRTT